MTPILFLPKLFLAGGAFLGAFQAPPPVDVMNHTLLGEKILASQVVCRARWGTPMIPDSTGGYSLIAPIKNDLIDQSLWIPPVSGSRPVPVMASTQ
jgi:hypothetical protein